MSDVNDAVNLQETSEHLIDVKNLKCVFRCFWERVGLGDFYSHKNST